MIKEFIGHLHPVVVHLPIGILMLACIFHWLSRKEQYVGLRSAARISLLLGMVTAIFACISGYFLSISDEYDEGLVNTHKWFGIVLAVCSILFYFFYRKNPDRKIHSIISVALFGLIIITGHLGGSLTHGSDFLTKSFSASAEDANLVRKPIPDVQEAIAYNDVIQPLFQSKCYSCHGKSRQKGGLRLDQQDRIMKGGKDGEVIVAGDAENSEMVRRLLLAREEEDHMPPKEKPQLKEHEIALIHWWIASGAPFSKKVKELPQSEKIKPILLALQSADEERMVVSEIPDKPVEKADEASLQKLKEAGILVLPVSQNTNYLLANFVTTPQNGDEEVKLLLPLRKQLVWLKLGNTAITDSSLQILSTFNNLRRLHIDHTQITDSGLSNLKKINELRFLNLVGTKVTAAGVMQLKDLKNLESIYLYQTGVDLSARELLKRTFPKINIDYGGYTVPMLASDTTVLKVPKKDRSP
ncbi:MAG TPA: c-type cytochrome domain-containing protein [Chitinophagaceae bacterium]|nr:c-type cytochrome domain-containing protein [Chitinophagaceae bacterium]